MIKSRLRLLIAQREYETGEKFSYERLSAEIGLTRNTLNRLANGSTDRISFVTLDKLCDYFDCEVGDLLEYITDEE